MKTMSNKQFYVSIAGILLVIGFCVFKIATPTPQGGLGGVDEPFIIYEMDDWMYATPTPALPTDIEIMASTTIATSGLLQADKDPKNGLTYVYSYRGQNIVVSVDLVGFNQCIGGMYATSTLPYCQGFLRKQVNDNLQWAKEAIDAKLKQDAVINQANLLDSKSF